MTETLYPPGTGNIPDPVGEITKRPDNGPFSLLEDTLSESYEDSLSDEGNLDYQEAKLIVDDAVLAGSISFEQMNLVLDLLKLDTAERLSFLSSIEANGVHIGNTSIPDTAEIEAEKTLEPDSNVPQLSAMEELIDKAKKLPLLTAHQEKLLGARIQRGDLEARNTMVEHNIRLVPYFIKPYLSSGISEDDLFMEGIGGLIRAAERFDPKRNIKFSTYAAWWIKQAFSRAISNYSRAIRIPVHVNERIRKINSAERRFREDYGFTPDEIELSEYANMPIKMLREAKEANSVKVLSLNAPVGEEKDSELGDFIDTRTLDDFEKSETAQVAESSLMSSFVRGKVKNLPDRHKKILALRHGLISPTQEPETLDNVSKALDMTREKIIKTEREALAMLAQDSDIQDLAQIENGEEDAPVYLDPEAELKSRNKSLLGQLDAIKSLIGYHLLAGDNAQTIAKKLGLNISLYKTYKREMFKDLGLEGNHRDMIQELGKLSILGGVSR